MRIVVDASAAISWVLDDERDALARAMAAEVLTHGAYVPPLFLSEIQNVLLLAIRHERASLNEVAEVLGAITRLPLSIDISALGLGSIRVVEIAVSSGLSVYDATYIVLARVLDAHLMTRDKRMRSAALALNLLWEETTS